MQVTCVLSGPRNFFHKIYHWLIQIFKMHLLSASFSSSAYPCCIFCCCWSTAVHSTVNEWSGMVLISVSSCFFWASTHHFISTLWFIREGKLLRQQITTRWLKKITSVKTYNYPSKILWLVVIQLEVYREEPMTDRYEVLLAQVFLWSTRATLLSKTPKPSELCLHAKIKRR